MGLILRREGQGTRVRAGQAAEPPILGDTAWQVILERTKPSVTIFLGKRSSCGPSFRALRVSPNIRRQGLLGCPTRAVGVTRAGGGKPSALSPASSVGQKVQTLTAATRGYLCT
jgi:hypothetical protein